MKAIIGNPNVGKSTFLYKLRDEGYSIFESDAWVIEQYKEGSVIFEELVSKFGASIISNDAIDKNALKRLIKEDFNVLHEIEVIVHPKLYAHLEQNTYDFVEIPILKWSPIDFTNLFEIVINIIDKPQVVKKSNVDNFSKSLIDTNKRAYREIDTVDIYVKTGQKCQEILKKYNIL